MYRYRYIQIWIKHFKKFIGKAKIPKNDCATGNL